MATTPEPTHPHGVPICENCGHTLYHKVLGDAGEQWLAVESDSPICLLTPTLGFVHMPIWPDLDLEQPCFKCGEALATGPGEYDLDEDAWGHTDCMRYDDERCPFCGSPGPNGECLPTCSYVECECGFKGDGDDHIDFAAIITGFAGGSIIHVVWKCGRTEHDDSADVEAAR